MPEPSRYAYGVLLQRAGKHKAASVCYVQALEQEPSNVKAHYNLALAYLALEKAAGECGSPTITPVTFFSIDVLRV